MATAAGENAGAWKTVEPPAPPARRGDVARSVGDGLRRPVACACRLLATDAMDMCPRRTALEEGDVAPRESGSLLPMALNARGWRGDTDRCDRGERERRESTVSSPERVTWYTDACSAGRAGAGAGAGGATRLVVVFTAEGGVMSVGEP